METLADYITVGQKRTDETMKMSSVDLKFQYVEKLFVGTQSSTREYDSVKFTVEKAIDKDALALVHDKGVIAVYHEDGKVDLHNPAILFSDMVEALSRKLLKIFYNTKRESMRYGRMANPNEEDAVMVCDFAAYLFLTGYKVRASKEMTANRNMLMDGVTDDIFKPLDERLSNLRINIHAIPLGDKRNDKLASFLLMKFDPQRKGLKGFLQQYLEE
jgi:hypothetical protein